MREVIHSDTIKWNAGGSQVWLNGNLTPSRLDLASVKNARCMGFANTNIIMNNSTDTAFADCPWAGYAPLANYFAQKRASVIPDESYSFGTLMQDIQIHQTSGFGAWIHGDSGHTWAVASNISIGAMARYIAGVAWCRAWSKIPPAAHLVTSLYRLKYGQLNGTRANVKGIVPLVRAPVLAG